MVKQSNKTNKTDNKLSGKRNESLYKGVRQRKWGKWVSEIRLPNSRQRIWLGSYDTPEKAARAFDAALFCLRGYSAKFNFPDNLPDVAVGTGRSLNPSEIQAIAARYANSEPSTSQSSESQTEYSSPSPSTSISEDTVQLESEGAFNGSSLDLLTPTDSNNYGSDYGMIFEDLDDLYKDILASSPLPAVNYEDGNLDGILVEDAFLWNF